VIKKDDLEPRFWSSVITSLILLFFITACAKPKDQFHVAIEMKHEAHSTWNVTYHLSQPVQGLMFTRQRNQFRAKTWQVVTAGAHIVVVDGVEVAYSDSGSFADLEVSFAPYSYETPVDYEFFVPFSDGSTSMFTGHLEVVPLACKGKISCQPQEMTQRTNDDVQTDFTFVPMSGEHVALQGNSSEGPSTWNSDHNGIYIYFGTLPFRDYGDFRGVLDPQLPAWIVQDLQSSMGQFLRYYSQRTGFNLHSKPLVYFPFVPIAYSYSAKGGVLPGQVRLALAGQYWSAQNAENSERFLELLAHEDAHFWNADLFVPQIDAGGSWLHEGGADAWAARALLNLGYITRERYFQIVTEALNRCVLGLGDIPLNKSDDMQRFRNPYDCGSTIGLLTEAAVEKAHGDYDLFTFWSVMFRNAGGGRYSPDMYFGLLNSMSAVPAIGPFVSSVVGTTINNIDQGFRQAFTSVGMHLNAADGPSWFSAALGERALRFLAAHDCGEGHSMVSSLYDSVRIDGSDACHSLKQSNLYEAAGTFNLISDGSKAYDFIFESCHNHGSVSLNLSHNSGAVNVPCSPLPPRPRYLEFK
jgi:hypothetical protein